MRAIKRNTGKLVTSAKKEGGGSGQNHDLRFLLNSDKSQRWGVRKNCHYLQNVLMCVLGAIIIKTKA